MYVWLTFWVASPEHCRLISNFSSVTVFKPSLQGCSQSIRPQVRAGIGDCPDADAGPIELCEVHRDVFIVSLSPCIASFPSRVSSANLLGMPLSFMKIPCGVGPCTDSWGTALVPGFNLDAELLTLTPYIQPIPYSPNKYIFLRRGHIRALEKILYP